MRDLVIFLIRRHIRTLYTEPLFVSLARSRSVQAGVATFAIYTAVFLALSRIEIQPSRTVELYPAVAVSILPPSEIETPETEPAAAVADGTEDEVSNLGEGIFSPNTGPGLEQVDSGDSDSQVESLPVNDLPSIGEDEVESAGVRNGEKQKVTKVQIKSNDEKGETVKPEPEPFVAPVTEPTQDEESPIEIAKEPEKTVEEHDAKPEMEPGRGNIMPAYKVDRNPRVSLLGEPAFPEEFEDKVFEFVVPLRVLVDARGKAVHVEPLLTVEYAFTEAAIKLVLETEFEPAFVGTLAVPSMVELSVEFVSYYEEVIE